LSERDLVFVSYSHLDTPYRDKLKVFLKPWMRRGVQYWADDYIKVGERWERSIDVAIGRARVGVLLVSPQFLASDFIFEKELPPLCEAHDGKQLTLVCIAVSSSAYRAAGLGVYQFSHPPERPLDAMSDAEQNATLVAIAEKIAAEFEDRLRPVPVLVNVARSAEPLVQPASGTLGALHGVPDLPRHYLERSTELESLRLALLEGSSIALGIVGIRGLGGIGKSVLATALAQDAEVRRAFPDGVFFVTFGQTPELTRLQNALAAQLGVADTEFTQPYQGRDSLRELFKAKACLLVLDDIWQYEHAAPFDVVGTRGRVLVTTRDAQVLGALGARAHDLGVLDPESSLRVLAKCAEISPLALPAAAREVAEECGQLPLALALAAAQVRDGVSFEHVLDALKSGKLEFLNHPSGSIWKTLRASVAALSAFEKARYRELVVVPEDTAMPASVVVSLWHASANLEPFETHQLLVRFANKSLLFLQGDERSRAVFFHDLQLDYLALITAHEKQALHGALLDAVALALPRDAAGSAVWSALKKSEEYLWQYLGRHLIEAGRLEQLCALPSDVSWLQTKLAVSGSAELLRELARIVASAPSPDIADIERALRLDASWLHQDPSALPGLLYNRLRCSGWEPEAIAAKLPDLKPGLRLRHPVRLETGELRILRGHTGDVAACAYSPDGTRVLSASWDETLREWDARTGQELRRFDGHSGDVTSCAYSPDGTRVLSGSGDETLREWDARTGRELRRFGGHSGDITACAYSPDGTRVLSGSGDETLREWDVRTGRELRSYEGHVGEVTACAYSPDGTRVLSSSGDRTLREWDAETARELRRFEGHTDAVRACAYSPDGRRVLSGSSDQTLREWDAKTGLELRRLKGHTATVAACAYSPNGTRLLSGSWDNSLREWDVDTGQCLRRFKGHTSAVRTCAYSPDGTRVLAGAKDQTLREWEARATQEERHFEGHTSPVVACAYRPDGARVLSGSEDRSLREWDAQTGLELQRFDGHTGPVATCVYSPNVTRVLSGSWDQTLREWDAQTGLELRRFEGHTRPVAACAYSPDGRRALSGSWDQTVREWDVLTGAQLRSLSGHSSNITSCAYSPDGTRALSGSSDRTLREWTLREWTSRGWDPDTNDKKRSRCFQGHTGSVGACAYNADGTRVLSGSWDQTLREWDTQSGLELRRFSGVSATVRACAYAFGGHYVVAALDDSTLGVWQATTGGRVATVYGVAPFRCVAVAASSFVAGDALGNVWILDWHHEELG
jgi:WD40 repeat protein